MAFLQAIYVGEQRYCCSRWAIQERKPAMDATVAVTSSIMGNFDPDIIRISVDLTGEAASKELAAAAYNEALSSLLDALEKMGVKRKGVKNGYLRISPVWKNRKGGGPHEYSSTVRFEEPCMKERLDAVWTAIAGLGGGISCCFDYDLKDNEEARETILRRAIDAGRKRAALLADAAGCDLGQIIHIDNSLQGNAAAGIVATAAPDKRRSIRMDASPVFNPEPVRVSCEVTLEYELIVRMQR